MFPTSALLDVVSAPFKRAQLGLFHGKTKQYGNSVPFSKKKTRRSWLPNIQNKRLESVALGQRLEVKVTTRALRTIAKYGGLDNYVMKTKAGLLGWEGMRIRALVRERLEEREREEGKRAVSEELETLRPQWDNARTRIEELKHAPLKRREEALRDLWRLEDRVHELETQLADGASGNRATA